jgi:hypothetical protein
MKKISQHKLLAMGKKPKVSKPKQDVKVKK